MIPHHFVTDYPQQSVQALIAILGGSEDYTAADFADATLQLTSFMAGQLLEDAPKMAAKKAAAKAKAHAPCTREQAVAFLQHMEAESAALNDPCPKAACAAVGGLPWQSIVSLLLDMLKNWISTL